METALGIQKGLPIVLMIDERTYYYHSECGTFNDEKNNQNLPVTAEEKENINAILAQYITLGLE